MNIDVHAHLLLPEMFGAAGPYGPRYVPTPDGCTALEVGPYRAKSNKNLAEIDKSTRFFDLDARIASMDAIGIDHLIQSTSPLFYLYWGDAEIGVTFARVQNDAMATFSSLRPERFSWSATLPMQDIDASLEEFRRSVDKGARAVSLGTNALGPYELDDQALWPLYAEIEARNVPILVHPHPLTMAEGGEDRYNLSWVVGYTYQETLAFTRLVLGGVFDDFPGLKVCLPHGGGAVPYQIGRIEEARRSQPDSRARRPVREYLGNFFFDILVHDPRARRLLYETVGAEQLLVGSNFAGWDAANGFAMLDEMALDPEEHALISHENAVRLFNLGDIVTDRVVDLGEVVTDRVG